ncbi:uncharacterized protein [Physcomitrium patens]
MRVGFIQSRGIRRPREARAGKGSTSIEAGAEGGAIQLQPHASEGAVESNWSSASCFTSSHDCLVFATALHPENRIASDRQNRHATADPPCEALARSNAAVVTWLYVSWSSVRWVRIFAVFSGLFLDQERLFKQKRYESGNSCLGSNIGIDYAIMNRGEGEPYNPYPEKEGHHHHHHHHHRHFSDEEQPRYGSNLEHRPPPMPVSGDAAPYGYGEGSYGQEGRRGAYEEQGYRHSGGYPPSGPRYVGPEYHNSPYVPAPRHHSVVTEDEGSRRRPVLGLPVRLHCKADPNFNLAAVPGQGPVMVPFSPNDDFQVWYKDVTMSTRVKDETGSSAFSLINKATGQALRHAPEDLAQCLLADYDSNALDQTVLWTMSEDMGQGYCCIRLASQITRNLDVLRGDKKSGGVKEGSPVITFAWKKQDNQIWKMITA